jgi:ABC-type multidrug transport system permease subunit
MSALRIALMNVRLAMRTKVALFFTFIFPLIFLFAYAGIFAHGNPYAVAYLFGPVLTLHVMGSAFWGLGLQSVAARERGSLRRYRLAPLGPATMVLASLVANYLLLLPVTALLLVCAVTLFHMPLKISLLDLFILVTVGAFGFAGFGLVIGSVANTMQEAQVYNNVVWFPLLFLSGTTIPLSMLPHWLQRVAAFLPATYLVSAFQGIMSQAESLQRHTAELAVLVVCGCAGLFFAWKLFRWEKEERIPRSAKLWSLACAVPLLLMGVWLNTRGDAAASWATTKKWAEMQGETAKSAGGKAEPAPPDSESGLVSDFDDGTAGAKFGSGWAVSTDSLMGGKSTAEFKVVSGGAQGSKGSLLITGEIVGSTRCFWAGAMFFPGPSRFAPVNLSTKKALSFWAKGDGQTYRVMLFSQSLGFVPATQTFVARPDWTKFVFPLASFQGMDGHDLEGVLFSGGKPGRFAFQIDDVRFE